MTSYALDLVNLVDGDVQPLGHYFDEPQAIQEFKKARGRGIADRGILISRVGLERPAFDQLELSKAIKQLSEKHASWKIAAAKGMTFAHVRNSASREVSYLLAPGEVPTTVGEIFFAAEVSLDRVLVRLDSLDFSEPEGELSGKKSLKTFLASATTFEFGSLVIAPLLATWAGRQQAKKSQILTLELPENISVRDFGSIFPWTTIAIITRTRWLRKEQLENNVRSVSAANTSIPKPFKFIQYVVSEIPLQWPAADISAEIFLAEIEETNDSRFYLADWAARHIQADFFWFIDDDDDINEAALQEVAGALTSRLEPGLIFLGAQQVSPNEGGPQKSSSIGHYYSPTLYGQAYSASNVIPFCSVVFPKSALVEISNLALRSLSYLEDHYLILQALSRLERAPLVIDKALVNINLRTSSQYKSHEDFEIWGRAQANLVWLWVNAPFLNNQGLLENGRSLASRPLTFRARAHILKSLFSPRTWKTFRINGGFAALLNAGLTSGKIRGWLRRL